MTEPERHPGRRGLATSLATGALAVVLGFGLTVQIRSANSAEADPATTEDDLARILDDLDSEEVRLRQQLAEQRRTVEELTSGRLSSRSVLSEVQERAEAIGVLNGTLPARGPGLRISISDPGDAVGPAVLLDAVQELRGAGAEALQLDGVRVVVSTWIGGTAGDVRVDGRRADAPYELLVIGPPEDLTVALNVPGGVVADVARAGGTAQIVQSERISVDATVG